MTATQHTPFHRTRATLAALLVGACSTVAVAMAPASAEVTADPATPTTRVEYGKGDLDTTQIALTGPGSEAADDPAAGATGWTTQVALKPGTEMVALTWDATASAAGGAISLRNRAPGGWTPWTTITPEAGEVGDGDTSRVGTDVVYLGDAGADAVEVKVATGPLVDLELMRMRYEEGEARTVTEQPQSRTATRGASKPTIRPRTDWTSKTWRYSNSGCSGGPTVATGLKAAVIHHTASANGYSASKVPGIIESIYDYHTGGRGWCDVAYNYLVDRFGTIWQGRSGDMAKPIVGGHTGGFNTGTVGVSLIGDYEAAVPTSAMLDSTAKVIAWKLSLHGLNPRGNATLVAGSGATGFDKGESVTVPVVAYHKILGQTACPGVNVIAKLSQVRDMVAWYMGASSPPPPPPEEPTGADVSPFATAEDLVWKQYVDFRRDPGAYADRKWWFDELKAGRTNRNAVVSALVRGDYVQDHTADSIRLYLTYFGRIPDSAGIRYWWSEVDRGRNLRTVSARFSGSPEFKSTYGTLTDEQFVRLIYRNVLGREGTSADVAWWTGQITSGKDSRGGVMALFSKTKEYTDRSQAVVDVILVHEVMLGRAINAQAHMQWVARVQSEGIAPLIGTLFASQEYAQRVGS